MSGRGNTMEDGTEFPCMGDHVADHGRDAMVWAGAGEDELAEFDALAARIERDEWDRLPSDKWGKTLPNAANEELFDEMGRIVSDALFGAELCVRQRDWIMVPRCLLDGPAIDTEESGYHIEINDHGNVTCWNGDDVLWSVV